MGKEIMSRRSFHSDRDFRGMLHFFDSDQALIGKNAVTDRIIEDGLEAPRNSLEISNGAFEMRRKSEARYSDIPFGYELTRSLTSKRRTEEREVRNFKILETSRQSEQRRKAPSIVARLMGLDAMPDDRATNTKKNVVDKKNITCPLSRQKPSEDQRMLPKLGEISTVESLREMPLQGYYEEYDDRLPSHIFSFREHPQEKQLQEFKKDFAARQALYYRNYQSEEVNTNFLNKQVQGKQDSSCKKFVKSAVPQKINEAEEFLDALEFLQSNKDFFLNVLHDPNSLFSRNIGHFCSPAKHRKPSYFNASRSTKHYWEIEKQGTQSYYTAEISKARRQGHSQQEQGQRLQKAKSLSDWRSQQKSRFQPNEEMPIRNHRHARQSSLPGNNSGHECITDQMPNRIVILKPSAGRHPNAKSSTLPSYSTHANVNYKVPKDQCKEVSKAIFQDTKEKVKYINKNFKRESQIGKEMSKDQHRDQSTDPREIAGEIVRKVKDDVNKKLTKESFRRGDTLCSQGNNITRRLSTQGTAVNSDTGGISDGEASCKPSRRLKNHSNKLHSSLPNSPRFERNSEVCHQHSEERRILVQKMKPDKVYQTEDSQNASGLLRKKDALGDSKRRSISLRVATSPRNLKKGVFDSSLHTHASSGTCPTLDSSKVDGSFSSRKSGNYQEKRGSLADVDSKTCSPSILPRSHSVPISTRNDSEHNFPDRSNITANYKSADYCLLKGKMSSLKDSFSVSKKTRKLDALAEESVNANSVGSAEETEVTTPRHIMPAQQLCKETVTGPRTSFTDTESWNTLGSSTEFSEQCSQTDCISTPEHQLAGRCIMGGRVDKTLVSAGLAEWGSATDAVDSGSESSLGKAEQPSPVSVLGPFEEGSPSPVDFQGNDPNFETLHELQLKLCLLYLDGAKTEDGGRYFGAQETSSLDPLIVTHRQASEDFKPSEFFSAYDIPRSSEREVDLTYIRDILVSSNFTMDDKTLVQCFSLDHGLDPSIFLKLEHRYHKTNGLGKQSFGGKAKQRLPNTVRRRLLFDAVDELILTKIGMPADHQCWMRNERPNKCFMWTGKDLIEMIWAEVDKYFSSEHESQDDTLEDLAAKALSESGSWLAFQSENERVGIKLEHGIFNTLIEEAVLDLLGLQI